MPHQPSIPATCPICGVDFLTWAYRLRQAKTAVCCSRACSVVLKTGQRRERKIEYCSICEKELERSRPGNLLCKTCYNRAWQKAHPGYNLAYVAKHPDKYAAALAAWRARYHANPAAFADRQRRYVETHREQIRATNRRNRRDRTTYKLRLTVYEREGGRCHICKKLVPKEHFSLDHITPRSKGGTDSATNLRIAHIGCNASRGNRGPGQFPLII